MKSNDNNSAYIATIATATTTTIVTSNTAIYGISWNLQHTTKKGTTCAHELPFVLRTIVIPKKANMQQQQQKQQAKK